MTTETETPSLTPVQEHLARFAREYAFTRTWEDGDKHTVHITRYSNHGRLIEDGAWVVVIIVGGSTLNPHYLGEGGEWRYKYGWRYATVDVAYEALRQSKSPKESWKTHP